MNGLDPTALRSSGRIGLSAGVLALLATVPGCMMEAVLWPPDTGTGPDDDVPFDQDKDGYSLDDGDCDDLDPLVAPGASEACNERDDDCDDVIDEGEPCFEEQWFVQELKADILVVVDTSVSMYDHGFVSLVADGASWFLEPLRGPGKETHIGVITADMVNLDGQGRLQEVRGRRWIPGTQMTDSAAVAWLGEAIVGDGSGELLPPPMPKAAIEAAVFDHAEGHNNGFFRTDAALAVLVVSDQDDPAAPTNGELLGALRGLKAGTGADVTVYAITQNDAVNCEGKGPTSTTLLELVAQTEGMNDSICRSEYGGFMAGVAQDIALNALGQVFTLDSPAQLGSVSVTVREAGSSTEYSWVGFSLRDAWTLVFNERPPAGAEITVTWQRDPSP